MPRAMRQFTRTRGQGSGGKCCCAAAALAAFSLSTAHAQVPCSYSVQVLPQVDCGTFGGAGNPTAINNLGTVVGFFSQCGSEGSSDSFIWDGGKELTIIQRPTGILSFAATDINDAGLITGIAETTTAGQRGYIYNSSTGEWTQLPPPNPNGQGWSSAESINNAGQVCGYRSLNDGGDPVNPWQAFVWDSQNGFTDLGVMVGPSSSAFDISESGAVSGTTGSAVSNARAFLWHEGELTVFPPIFDGYTSGAAGLNDHLQVVGAGEQIVDGDVVILPFQWHDGVMTMLPLLPGYDWGSASSIHLNGTIFGRCTVSNDPSDRRACFWKSGKVFDLVEFIDDEAVVKVTEVKGPNQLGQLYCFGLIEGIGTATFILTPLCVVGDTNNDGTVDVDDLLNVINQWGKCDECFGDLDFNGVVDLNDLLAVLNNWTSF